ncbi:MAG: hypothetical protein IT185_09195 [Acidobacteria bacterium]|nr:hypothetical protein [Acidobacteriota bacterium]
MMGHDPRLQRSETRAEYALFANFFFKPVPTSPNALAKYKLAKSLFDYVRALASQGYHVDQIVVTNLCNAALPHAPKGKTVLITEQHARAGIADIHHILSQSTQSTVEVIFAMSQQGYASIPPCMSRIGRSEGNSIAPTQRPMKRAY